MISKGQRPELSYQIIDMLVFNKMGQKEVTSDVNFELDIDEAVVSEKSLLSILLASDCPSVRVSQLTFRSNNLRFQTRL